MAQENKGISNPGSSGQRQSAGGLSRAEQRGRGGIAPSYSGTPFNLMRRMFDDMDRVFETFGLQRSDFFPDANLFAGGGRAWAPQIEVFERNGQFIVRADLPGLKKEDVNIELRENSISIEGERKFEHEENKEGLYRSERGYGSFSRTIPLPEGVRGEDAKASFENGVLEITMKAPERGPKSRRIDIQEGAGSKSVH